MIVRNVFGKDSQYLEDLSAINFYPAVIPASETTRDMRWKSGTSELKNLYNTMLEELGLFSSSQPAKAIVPTAKSDEYDLAFSFAGEDRSYVEKIKKECEVLGLTVYYDIDRRIDQWGKSFIGEQRKVYSGYRTKHFIPFISKHYFAKPIPTDEFRSALMESTKRSNYILPIKLDDSKISVEYLHADTQYLKSSDYTPAQLAGALKYMVNRDTAPAKEVDQLLTDELDLPAPKITPRAYSKFEEAEALITYVGDKFEEHLTELRSEGYVPIVRQNGDSLRVMVERDGKTQFVLNLFFSVTGDNQLGYNFARQQMMANAQSMNGFIDPDYNREERKTGYRLNDFSGTSSTSFRSKKEIMEFFWNKMNKTLESYAN